ncbi:hypothetical protein KR044_010236, partial [Drosophila immigrans]
LALSSTMWVPFIFLLILDLGFSATVTRFTNVKCEVFERSLISFKECKLKILGRGIVGLNLHMEIYNSTIKNVKINLSLWRKFSGFRPFMYNNTFDFCKYAEKPTFSFQHIVLSAVKECSNINHTCPYKEDVIIHNMIFKEEYFRLMPLPAGEYQFQVLIATYNKWRTVIKATILHNENLMK